MTLKDCYDALGGGYEDVMGRLHSERLVQRIVLKFVDDPSFDTLCTALEAGNQEEAFRAAHTMKGVCQNLGFAKLGDSSSRMTEHLRAGDMDAGRAMLEEVRQDYTQAVNAIRAFQSAL